MLSDDDRVIETSRNILNVLISAFKICYVLNFENQWEKRKCSDFTIFFSVAFWRFCSIAKETIGFFIHV